MLLPRSPKGKSTDRPALNAQFVSEERGVLYEDHSANLWLGASSLYRLSEQKAKPVLEKVELNLPTNPSHAFGITEICEARDQSLWLATSWGLIGRFPDGKEVFYKIDDPRINLLRKHLARQQRQSLGRRRNRSLCYPS